MSDRPPPSSAAPDGYHHEAVADTDWIVPPIGSGRCRWMENRRACGKPPVATLLRGLQRRAYDYCEQHLYGRWMENNKVMSWRLVADSAAEQGEAK